MHGKKKYKRLRWIILITWTLLGTALIVSVLTVKYHMEQKGIITKLVAVYIAGSCVLSGVVYQLKKKEKI